MWTFNEKYWDKKFNRDSGNWIRIDAETEIESHTHKKNSLILLISPSFDGE